LAGVLNEILSHDTAEGWAARMDAAGVPCSPVNNIDAVLNLPQVAHRDMVVDMPRDDIPDLRLPGVAIKMSDTPGSVRTPPPDLGQHTAEVLEAAGYDTAAVDRFRDSGVV
jgi:CoA:oxalate CoA-transferase